MFRGGQMKSNVFLYNSKNNSFKPENLTPIIEYPEFKDIVVNEILVKAGMEKKFLISLIYHKNIKKTDVIHC